MSSCANLIIPLTPNAAVKLRIDAEQFTGFSGIRAVYYPTGDCADPRVLAVISGIHTTKSDPGIQMPAALVSKEGTYVDRLVGSGDVNITIRGNGFGTYCYVAGRFQTNPNMSYLMRYYWSNNKCYMTVDELSVNSERPLARSVPVEKQVNSCKVALRDQRFDSFN